MVLALLLSGSAWAQTVIHAGRLVDAAAGAVIEAATIVVDGDRIESVQLGYVGEPDIDLTGAFVMPGWIDMHVHIANQQSPDRFLENFTLEPADSALRAVPYSERTLTAGFTTVRDLGTEHGVAQSIRRAVAEGHIVGPRIFTAGKSLATTGGHADPSNGVNSELRGDPGPTQGVVNGLDDAYKAVRARYKEGADLIKITATGGVLSQASSGQNPQFTEAEIAAIVAAAEDYGYRVAAHAHGAEGMRRAVAAGVHSIEHGTYMSDEVMELMREKGTWYVPTIIAGKFATAQAEVEGYFSEVVRAKAAAIGPLIADTFARAYRTGVPIAFGTDSGVSPHGDNWKEFVYMVEAGMPVMEAIASATRSAAILLNEWENLGSIEPGKYADIIAVPGDPREDVDEFGRVHFVMKGGKVFKQ
ncbi:amidohydrolase family protein [Candidatus Rariloculus sp.]|uniref:metal-dependent hydrolase family protein n=1 Tax=Candidatus Rariloculus sp. TaxID=3101265 RepID=UPI003D0DA929